MFSGSEGVEFAGGHEEEGYGRNEGGPHVQLALSHHPTQYPAIRHTIKEL